MKTRATVTSLDDPHSGVYYPDSSPLIGYRFQIGDQRYEGLARISRGSFLRLAIGGEVEILYLPDRPAVNGLADDVKRPLSRPLTVALVAFANGLAGLLLPRLILARRIRGTIRSTQFWPVRR
ncbi:MAG: hypothetical protein ACE149_07255 [Armatimonadota bacterium]